MLSESGVAANDRVRSSSRLDALRIDTSPVPASQFVGAVPVCSADESLTVVRPRSAEEVERLVKWARAHATPLSVFSSPSGPRRRGLTSSDAPIVVDLGQMRRIFHIDAEEAVAIIEPGLSFAELDAALAPHGLRTFKPLLPRAGKSVLASCLEREPPLVAREHWDVLDPLGAAHIVFGTGERFYTGAAGNPGTMDEHWKAGMRYMTATGPVGTDFMRVMQGSQGTLGIVCWAAVFCDRLPAAEQSLLIGSATLEPLLRLLSEIHYRRLGHASFISNRRHLALLATATGAAADPAGIPEWTLFINVAASAELPQERLEYELGDIEALVANEGLRTVPDLGGLDAQAIMDLHANLAPQNYKDRLSGGHREVFFITQADRVPRFVELAAHLAERHGLSPEEIATYVQPRLQGRNCHLEFVLPAVAAGGGDSEALADALARACCEAGGFLSRPYGNWTDMAYEGNPALVPYLCHTKSMFDPDRILHPERLGL